MVSGFFDVRDDSDLFGILVRTLEAYKSTRAKRVEDLLLLVWGLAHLREWIAPGYRRGATPSTAAERFVEGLWKETDYLTLLQLANHAKHQRREALPETQTVKAELLWDDRDTPIDSWMDTDAGPAETYAYGGEDLVAVFEVVVRFYQEGWFDLPLERRLG